MNSIGGPLSVTLNWACIRRPTRNWTKSIHFAALPQVLAVRLGSYAGLQKWELMQVAVEKLANSQGQPGDTCRFGRKFSRPASKSPLSAMPIPFLLHRSQIQSDHTILRRGAMERAVLRKCTRWRHSATAGQRYLARRHCARLPVYRLSADKNFNTVSATKTRRFNKANNSSPVS